ncbi:hypothetical protein BD408DRAFT_470126 [Parasitella parasitica]|nr:hypothetical protein BD408DRAFT_470126 [Parasitella parasitica]
MRHARIHHNNISLYKEESLKFQKYNGIKKLTVARQSTEEHSLCGFCLNGVLDLSNQKELGSKKLKHLPNLSNATKEKVEKIIKEIKSGQEEEAYYIAIESIRGVHSADKWIFKALGHIINAYRERTYIFTNPTNKISESDFLMKLWNLELLVGNSSELYVNWEESCTLANIWRAHYRFVFNQKAFETAAVMNSIRLDISKLIDEDQVHASL